jgi:hypothetical protein
MLFVRPVRDSGGACFGRSVLCRLKDAVSGQNIAYASDKGCTVANIERANPLES